MHQFFSLTRNNQITSNGVRTANEISKLQNKLNSQRIEEIFGDFNITLIHQNEDKRISSLNSFSIMRTCAITQFLTIIPEGFQPTHQEIYNGASIGKTITDAGFMCEKKPIYYGNIKLSYQLMHRMETSKTMAAIQIYQLIVTNPITSVSFEYCEITEIHSPLYLALEDIHKLSPVNREISTITPWIQRKIDSCNDLDSFLNTSKSMANC